CAPSGPACTNESLPVSHFHPIAEGVADKTLYVFLCLIPEPGPRTLARFCSALGFVPLVASCWQDSCPAPSGVGPHCRVVRARCAFVHRPGCAANGLTALEAVRTAAGLLRFVFRVV